MINSSSVHTKRECSGSGTKLFFTRFTFKTLNHAGIITPFIESILDSIFVGIKISTVGIWAVFFMQRYMQEEIKVGLI